METNDESLKARLVALMESIDRNAATAHPRSQEDVSPGQELVIRLLAGCRMLFRAIHRLLVEDYSEEARILSRTLLDDTARLLFLLSEQSDIEEWAASFTIDSLREGVALVQFERSIALPGAVDRLHELEALIQERQQEARSAYGRRPSSFPGTADILKKLDRRDLYWFFKVASHSVHTTTLALDSRAREHAPGHFVVAMEGSFETLISVGILACALMSSATIAATTLLGWDTLRSVASFGEVVLNEIHTIRVTAQASGYLQDYEETGGEGSQVEW
jgi:hypothetical protein